MTAVQHTDSHEQDVLDLLMSEHRDAESLLDQIGGGAGTGPAFDPAGMG